MTSAQGLLLAYRLRWRRRRLLARAWRKRHELTNVSDRTHLIRPGAILGFSTMRNEATRLPYWLSHLRALGVAHFLIVDNGSDDGTAQALAAEPDVSLWSSGASYKAARFGVDWLTWLQRRYAHGHWALTLDADETLIYPDSAARPLSDLTQWLRARGAPAFGATMLDLYPDSTLAKLAYSPGEPPQNTLTHFDPWGYTWEWQPKYRNISIRGGPRKRVFFADTPDHAPHLHKVPLIDWRRSYAYTSSTHIALPRRLNAALDARNSVPTGVLLHSKFLPEIVEKSAEEKLRREHFTHPDRYAAYYDRIALNPNLIGPDSTAFEGPEQLESLGLMRRGDW